MDNQCTRIHWRKDEKCPNCGMWLGDAPVSYERFLEKIQEPGITFICEYCIVLDNDGHSYVIPYFKMNEWQDFIALDLNDERSRNVPDFAERTNGKIVLFREWRLRGGQHR